MKAPLEWMLSYTDVQIEGNEAIHDLASKMTISGSKVESVETRGESIQKVVVGKCIACNRMENSDHLWICSMDVGQAQPLQIVTGAPNVRQGGYIPVALDGSCIAEGKIIKKGKLRGVESCGMMCSFEELGLDHNSYKGGIEDGIIILQDLEMYSSYTEEQLNGLIGRNIMDVLDANDCIVDFEITSNRADCFSILGLSREAAITMGGKFTKPVIEVKEEAEEETADLLKVDIQAPDLCFRYTGRVVKDVVIEPSPSWMQKRLENAGIRAINNIVDITNYVMLEYGQPMHAFDRRTISGGKIIVRRAGDGEIIKTLDGEERTMDSNMLVIADGEGPVGIAGVMGGENSEIRPDTTEIIFESAVFDGVTVRKGAKKVGLRTESSSRFEKGLDPENSIDAINRAVQLVEMLGAGKVCKGVVDCYPTKVTERKIKCSVDKINKFIGINASEEEMCSILTQLECKPCFAEGYVIPPSFRQDLICDADIAEEVARFYGYNRIESSLLEGCKTTLGRRNRKQQISDKVRHAMVGAGYSEMLTFSFVSPGVFDKMRLPEDNPLRDGVRIINPLGEDFSIMRTSMIPSLLESLANNKAHKVVQAALFEISYIYIKNTEDSEKLPEHRELLSFGYYNMGDFYSLKGDVENLLSALKITKYEFKAESGDPSFHPGRTAVLLINGKKAGILGQIHPEVCENFDCPKDTFACFIETNALIDAAVDIPKQKELPRFPAVERDIAIVIDDNIPAGDVEKVIKERGGANLASYKLFDVYKGAQLGEGKKSLAYALAFRAQDRTLTDEDVAKFMKKILNGLEMRLGAALR